MKQKQQLGIAWVGHGFYWGFHGKEAREYRVNSLELSSLNNFGGLWAISMVSGCLVPGLGMARQRNSVIFSVCMG